MTSNTYESLGDIYTCQCVCPADWINARGGRGWGISYWSVCLSLNLDPYDYACLGKGIDLICLLFNVQSTVMSHIKTTHTDSQKYKEKNLDIDIFFFINLIFSCKEKKPTTTKTVYFSKIFYFQLRPTIKMSQLPPPKKIGGERGGGRRGWSNRPTNQTKEIWLPQDLNPRPVTKKINK